MRASLQRQRQMSEAQIAEQVLCCLEETGHAEPDAAVGALKNLIVFFHGSRTAHSFAVDEARSSTFMAICEYAKALHRGQPADTLRPVAIEAAAKWRALAE